MPPSNPQPYPPTPPAKRAFLPIWLHVAIDTLLLLVCFLAALLLSAILIHLLHIRSEFLSTLLTLAISAILILIPQYLMFTCIPARCPRCHGRCWAPRPKGIETLKFRCEHCAKTTDTGLSAE